MNLTLVVLFLISLGAFTPAQANCYSVPNKLQFADASFDSHLDFSIDTTKSVKYTLKYNGATYEIHPSIIGICADFVPSKKKNDEKCGKETTLVLPPIQDEKGNVVGIFDIAYHDPTNSYELFLFSTTNGKKDLQKLYLKITHPKTNDLVMEAYEKTQPVGSLQAKISPSEYTGASEKMMPLKGFDYSSQKYGKCAGGFFRAEATAESPRRSDNSDTSQ